MKRRIGTAVVGLSVLGYGILTIREIHGLRVTHMEIQEHQLIQSLVGGFS